MLSFVLYGVHNNRLRGKRVGVTLQHRVGLREEGPRLSAMFSPVTALSEDQRKAMFALYSRYYEATSKGVFSHDLQDKDQALLLSDQEGVLRGFSTLKLLESDWQGCRCRIIFSGDTIVHHRFWGEQSLAFAWIRQAGSIWAEQPDTPLYWLLIVKGHRTYRYLQAFSRRYYPHWQSPTPAAEQGLMDQLGAELFGEDYDPASGVVHFPVSRGQLQAEWAEPPQEVQVRPEVQLFLQRNPGYRRGDELLCLTELHPDNLRPLARRLFLAGAQG